MNILHISTAKSWRGGERQIHFLMEGLASKGDNVYLMCPDESELKNRARTVYIDQVSYANGWNHILGNITRFRRCLREADIDIVHCHDSHAHTLAYAASKLKRDIPEVVVSRRLANPISSKSLKKYNSPIISKYICVSDYVHKIMRLSISDHSKLETIRSGVDLGKPRAITTIRKEGTVTIGYVAALAPEKNHEMFLVVAQSLLRKSYDVRFVIIGAGGEAERLKRIVHEWTLAEDRSKVDFKGFVTDVDAEYQEIDILFHPSKEEALGTSILDAQSFGVPVLASGVGGIPELVTDGYNGFLGQPNTADVFVNKAIQLIESSELREKFARRSLETVKEFSKRKMIEKTRKLYCRIIGQ